MASKRLHRECVAESIKHVVQEGSPAAPLSCNSCFEWADKLPIIPWRLGEIE